MRGGRPGFGRPGFGRPGFGRPGFGSARGGSRCPGSFGPGCRGKLGSALARGRMRFDPRCLYPSRIRLPLRGEGMALGLLGRRRGFTLLHLLMAGDLLLRGIGLLAMDIGDRLLPGGFFLLHGRLAVR